MKIRTGFVTNSSSSSFIAIKVITKDGQQYAAELDSGNVEIDAEIHDGRLDFEIDDFDSIGKVSDLFDKAYKWFYESLVDPECGFDDMDDAFMIYGSGDISEIRALGKDDVRYAEIFSREELDDEPWGASLIGYDYLAKTFNEEHREGILAGNEEDTYGEKLYKRFSSDPELGPVPDPAEREKNTLPEAGPGIDVSAIGDHATIGGAAWTVIAVDGSRALLLADKSVGKKPYNKQSKEVTWEICTLRKWLNEDYYKKLSDDEKAIILEVENENPGNTETGVSGGNKTKDKVFILSLEEIKKYLPEESGRGNGEWWWIRTPAEEQRQALVIEPDGSILKDDGWVEFACWIRPAVWIKL